MKSPSRVEVGASERRLLLGYGPAILMIAAFLVMALLVPTVAPEQNVAEQGSVAGAPTSPGAATPGAVAGTVPGGTPVAGSAAATGGAGSSGAATAVGVGSCPGPQVPGDPYSPPCTTFSGSNGGATYQGVTDKQIVVTYFNGTDGSHSVDEAIAAVIGHYSAGVFPETYAQVLSNLQDLVTYFNTKFQLYGRKIVLKVFNGQADGAGTNQSQVNADAINVADSIKAFAEVNASSQAYEEALSARKVLNLGTTYLSQEFYESKAPYAWSPGPNCSELGKDLGAVAVKQLADHPVSFGGTGVDNGKPRRFVVISPDSPELRKCAGYTVAAMQKAGHPPVSTIAYSSDPSRAAATTQAIAQQIVNDKDTTILCLCDSVMQLLVGGNLDNANYLSEWFNAAVLAEESDVIAQQENQNAWGHVAVLTSEVAVPGKYGSTIGYFAVKSVDPHTFVVNEVDVLYQQLYQLVLGIQLAGPNLTPATFAQGMARYQGGDGIYGPYQYNVGGSLFYTPIRKFRLQYYDPTKISSYDGAKGTFVVLPDWYTADSLPTGPTPVYPNGGISR